MSENQRQYRVWQENGDLWGEYDNPEQMEREADKAREYCRRNFCHTNGQEQTPGKGDFKCGVLSEHGISTQVVEGDDDVTQDYLINGGA